MTMLLLLKLAVPPVLVAVISLAARAWGPTVGALLMGLPWLTGPVLFFLTLEKGADFGVGASAGILLGVVCLTACWDRLPGTPVPGLVLLALGAALLGAGCWEGQVAVASALRWGLALTFLACAVPVWMPGVSRPEATGRSRFFGCWRSSSTSCASLTR